jgi:hypothetical protein
METNTDNFNQVLTFQFKQVPPCQQFNFNEKQHSVDKISGAVFPGPSDVFFSIFNFQNKSRVCLL